MEKNLKIYTQDEVKKETLKYFKGDELATDVWMRKYCLKDENTYYELSPNDMHHRIAKELARIESKYPNPLTEEEIFETLKDFKRIVPQGSPMSGIGNTLQIVSLSNCFVIGNEKDSDSYGGIMKLDQEMVQLQKRRGGVGLDLSFIRPAGSPVKNSAITSTGVVPFMERYSNSTKEVAQDGRRGALMESISIKHPDAEAFIDAKLTAGKVTGANVSVRITDEFMNAVISGSDYIQSYPLDANIDLDSSIRVEDLEYDKIHKSVLAYYKKVDARKLWQKIIHNAWKSAEPGILFWDTVINESLPDCYADLGFKTTSTNPCFPSSEYLLTENGYYKFGDLVTNDSTNTNNIVCDKRISYVDNGNEKPENWKIDNNQSGTVIRKASNVFLTQKDAEIIELKTSKGFKLRCTPDHHIATTVGMIEAKDLTPNDDILISIPDNNGTIVNKKPETTLEMLGLLLGLNQGDGTLDKKRKRIYFDFWGIDAERIKNLVCNIVDKLYDNLGERKNEKNKALSKYFISKKENKIRIGSAWIGKIFEEFGFDFNNKLHIPEFIFNNSSNNVGKFYIAGLMYSDGSLQGTARSGYSIRLSQSNEEFLNKVQMILHSNGLIFGIYKRRDEKLTELPNGNGGYSKYKTKEQYELISLGGSIVRYMSSIGFLGDINRENKFNSTHNYQIKKSFTDNIIEIKQLNNEPVFCLKEDIGRNIIVNGISARRCGEIPLCPDDSCRLLALNLYGYVVNPFEKNAYFDWELFKSDVIKAQRYMDDIIDLEIEKIDAILDKIKSDPEEEFIKQYEIALWKRIKNKAITGRRTGLGITAEGDMIAALGMIYGTDEANNFSENIHKTLKLEAYRSSVIMAKERGTFPIYNAEREDNNPFIRRIMDEDTALYNQMVTYGRRNIALLTIAPTGCSDKDSIVTTNNGFFKLSELCDVNRDGFHELSRDVDVIQDISISKATKAFNNGFAKTKRIITTSGIELESTLNHQYKIITENGEYVWKRVSDLIEGDMLVSRIGGYSNMTNAKLKQVSIESDDEKYWQFKAKEITQPNEIDEKFAKFLGIFYADGSVHDKGIRIHCDYGSEQINEVIKLVKEIFNIEVNSRIECTCESVYISSKTILNFLKTNSLLKQKAHEIEIPLLIRMSSKKSIESFIDGYWMGDGSKTNNTKYIDTVSKKMAQQLAIILRGLGKNVKIRVDSDRKSSKGKRPLYRIYEKGFGSVGFDGDRYIRNDYKNWLNLTRKYGDELFFDEIIELIDSETMTLDIEVPNKNMYLLNSSVSHNTVSLMTQTTSGIEPVFLPVYKRRRKINPNDKDVRVDFVDGEGISWQEYPVFHHKFETWLEVNGYDLKIVKSMTYDQVQEIVKKSPYYKATSNDVDWVKKVEMQGMVQKHVDHSISTTTNLPEDVTEEVVSQIYLTGWEVGCKGITVYRDGSRSGVLISDSNKKEKEKIELFKEVHAPKRPKRLKGEIMRFQNNLEKWIAVVGLIDGRPYEIFTGKLENGLSNLPPSIKECEIVKNIIEVDGVDEEGNPIKVRKKRYDIEYVDNNGQKQCHTGLNHAFNPEYWNYAKLISGNLRHGMPLIYVYELISSLNLRDDVLNTWKNGMARIIKRYIKNGEKMKDRCPECGGDDFIFQEGCLQCSNCGYSKCG